VLTFPPAARLRLEHKLILPFALLLLLLGVMGIAVVGTQFNGAAVEQLNAQLVNASLAVQNELTRAESARLIELGRMAGTEGVPQALARGDGQALRRLLEPLRLSAEAPDRSVVVLDDKGREVLRLGTAALDTTSLASAAPVQGALSRGTDPVGDKFVLLTQDQEQHAFLYTVGPVQDEAGKVRGVLLVGDALDALAQRLEGSTGRKVIFYGPDGHRLAGPALPAFDTVPLAQRGTVAEGRGVIRERVTGDGHETFALLSDWQARDQTMGYLRVIAPADASVQAAADRARLFLVLIFLVASALTLVIGHILARRITAPIGALVRSTQVVAAGDLSHRARVGAQDEIGQLARSFNAMTSSLQEKTASLEAAYFASIEALARAIDARDPSTFGHSERVSRCAQVLAAEMRLSPDDCETLRRGALLHDIGKIGIADRILRKPDRLSSGEAEAMRQHPVIGYRMLHEVPFLHKSLPGIHWHHERWDGSGYPAGLAGENIPLFVRILTVTDTLDAMTSDRPYRAGLPFEAAITEITAAAGKAFDPRVVEALLRQESAIRAMLTQMQAQAGVRRGLPDLRAVGE
jgi:putative nucleotidyltransferase with HDIG domain